MFWQYYVSLFNSAATRRNPCKDLDSRGKILVSCALPAACDERKIGETAGNRLPTTYLRWPLLVAAARANKETRTWPAAIMTGCTAGGGTCEDDQWCGRSQPSTVRTQSDDDGDRTKSAERTSMRHDMKPAPASNSRIPRIERMGGVALAPGAASAIEGGEGAGEKSLGRGLRWGDRTSSVFRKVDAARESSSRSVRKRRENRVKISPQPGADCSDVAKRRRAEPTIVESCQHDKSSVLSNRSWLPMSFGLGRAARMASARRQSFPQRIDRIRRRSLRWRNRLPFLRRCRRVSAKNDLGTSE